MGWENGWDKLEDNDNVNMFWFFILKLKNVFILWEYMNVFEVCYMLLIIGIFVIYGGGGYVFFLNDSLEDVNMIVDY